MGRINNQITDFINHWFGKIRLVKPKAEDHNEFVARYRRFDQFAYQWNKSFERQAIMSEKEITFSQYFGFGSNIDFIKRLLGQPMAAFGHPESNISVLLYTISVNGHKVQFELHFHDSKLFSICYTYRSINEETRRSIIQSLLAKQGLSGSIDMQDSIITDSYGNGLLINNKQNFSISYLSPQSQVKHITQKWSEMRVG